MWARIKALRETRLKAVADARAILDKAEKEGRSLVAEERSAWDALMKTVDNLKDEIDVLQQQADAERDEDPPDEEDESDREDEDADREDDEEEGYADDGEEPARHKKSAKGKKRAKRHGKPGGKRLAQREGESRDVFAARVRRSSPEYRAAYNAYLLNGENAVMRGLHARAIQADSDIVGGYMVAPQEFTGELIKFVDNLLWIRQKATKYTVAAAQSLGAPSLDTDPSDALWTSELATGNEDTAMAFGKRELTPHPLAKRIKVSNKLLRMATISGTFSQHDAQATGGGAESLVRARLGYKFAVTEEEAFMTGNGAMQPLGLFTASARGISTGRDVATGSTNSFVADAFFTVKYNLKAQYQGEAEWVFHRNAMPLIRTLKDGNGQYLWAPGLAGKDPDTLLDRPVLLSEYCPNTYTTGLYVGLFGVLKFYWIVDAETMVVQRLMELYAEANQVGFIARMELDGMPVLEEAFTRLKFS